MIHLTTTSPAAQFQQGQQSPQFARGSAGDLPVVRIDANQQHQEILGFGAAFTDAACYVFSRLTPARRRKLFQDLFASDQMGLSVCRTCVGASDYSVSCYTYDDTPDDWTLKDFSIDYDRAYIIPMMREARKVNPDLFLFSSPWSPPGWMKTGGSVRGGWMREKYLEVYARYYLRYLLDYQAAGVRIDAMTAQNESETDQCCKMPACLWHPEYEMSFVRDYMKPLIRQHNLPTRIWLMDHNYIMWRRAKWMLDDPGVREAADGVAFHHYEGKPEMMSLLHEAYPQVDLFWTEGGPAIDRPEYATNWCFWARSITDAMTHWCRCYTGWNLALDEQGKPNIGHFNCGGMVTIHSQTQQITYSGQYWALKQFSTFVKRGARRLGSQSAADKLHHIAFVNPDGGKVVVLTNSGPTRTVALEYGKRLAKVELPADSVTTLTWAD